MKIEMHILQNFAPSNLNRDDSGMPKDCDFGGYRRARISSQCLKKRIRESEGFINVIQEDPGVRTKMSYDWLKEKVITDYGYNQDQAHLFAEHLLAALGLQLKQDKRTEAFLTKYLFYTDRKELIELAKLINSDEDIPELLQVATDGASKKTDVKNAVKSIKDIADKVVKEFLKTNSHRIDSVDIALFGRMLADKPEMKIDAACQVAHAISTNRVSMDFDYFTAVDDLLPDEETGAGMIGNIGYNSSCFYRYSVIDFDQLRFNLSNKTDHALNGVIGFIEGAIEAIPTGKQNSFAAQNPPAFVMVNIKENDIPVSLANAFEKPVKPFADNSLTDESVLKLDEYWGKITSAYGIQNKFVGFFRIDKSSKLEKLGEYEKQNKQELIEAVENSMKEILGTEE